jgi:SAM-dependent methyltransferase
MIPILRPDGSEAELVDDPDHFPTSIAPEGWPAAPIRPEDFLDEPHHRYYGRPWLLGRHYFDQLRARGLKRRHRVLDLGCGAGRVGVWLAAWLDKRRYCGVDAHLRALTAFATYECMLHGLQSKQPRLLFSDGFEVEAFGERFDVVLDFYLSPHLSRDAALDAFARAAAVCRPGARLFSLTPTLTAEDMAGAGFQLTESFEARYPLMGAMGEKGGDAWRIFTRRR